MEQAVCGATGVAATYSRPENVVYVQVPGREPVKAGNFEGVFGPGYWRIVANAVKSAARMLMPSQQRDASARDQRRATAYRRLISPDSNASPSERAQAQAHLDRLGANP